MNLAALLAERACAVKSGSAQPVRVGIIGAGKFGSMVLAQLRHLEGLHVVAVADLDIKKARAALARVGWPETQYQAQNIDAALREGTTCIVEDAEQLIRCEQINCIVEATGHPLAGTRHALHAVENHKHVVMVNVEADVLCGPLIADRARQNGVIYSMAYGDQPAIICELDRKSVV